jgi:asparagine synthase (glutamine-hydrolysing)
MSGIVAILNRNRAPVNQDLLGKMTRFMAFRGPDAQQVWLNGEVGFGHTLLKTTWESDREQQPCTLDGQVWITADARVDARVELMGKLESAGCSDVRQATDPELILHAYQVWGEESPKQLLGDFAFVIWDGRRHLLFCARDHFGVKHLFYAEAGKSLLCGNTLNCLRLDPEVSDQLNDLSIADFLLFDCNQDPATTSFAGIQRLPPGHSLVCTETTLRISRYWSLPVEEIRYKRAYDYVDRFIELFGEAVKDRIRTDKLTVSMSGGRDSTLIAAYANRALGRPSDRSGVRAHTMVFDSLFPDGERKYSQMAADFMGIPIRHLAADDYHPYAAQCSWQFSKAEPQHNPQPAVDAESYRQIAEYSRVVLTGNGADPTLHTNEGYIADYLKFRALGELASGIAWCIWSSRRFPRLGIRTLLQGRRGNGKPSFRPPYPVWLNRELEKRFELPGRWDYLNNQSVPVESGRWFARQLVLSPVWTSVFNCLDPGDTQCALEYRHPFFDVRLATFLTAIPSLPWCQEKNILKAAGRGLLPDAVRYRPKAPAGGDPIWERLRGCGADWWAQHLDPVPEIFRYANVDVIPRAGLEDPYELWMDLRLVSLNYWLRLGRKSSKTSCLTMS